MARSLPSGRPNTSTLVTLGGGLCRSVTGTGPPLGAVWCTGVGVDTTAGRVATLGGSPCMHG